MWKKTALRALLAAICLVSNVTEAGDIASKLEGLDVSMTVNAQEMTGSGGQDVERKLDGPDEWFLMFTNTSLGNHTNALDGMVLEYKVGKNKTLGQLTSTVYDESCLIQKDDPSVMVSGIMLEEMIGMDYDAGAISIDIDTTTVENSTFWDSESEATGVISFCVKTELWTMDLNTSVSFSETVVHSSINFEAGFASFEIDDIALLKYNASEVVETTQMDASACICDDSKVCDEDPVLSQNTPFNLCVIPEGEGLEVSEIKAVTIYQDGIDKFMPVTSGEVNSITEIFPGAIGVIKTRMVSVFFESSDPMDVVITGEVVLDFAPDVSRSLGAAHVGKKVKKAATFNLQAGLVSTEANAAKTHGVFAFGAFIFVAGLFFAKNRLGGGQAYVHLSTEEF